MCKHILAKVKIFLGFAKILFGEIGGKANKKTGERDALRFGLGMKPQV